MPAARARRAAAILRARRRTSQTTPTPAATTHPARPGLLEVFVSNNNRTKYPAYVDPAERHPEGWVKPYFTLEVAHLIAENTQADAAQFGHNTIDTVHVYEGGHEDGTPRVVIAVITWMHIETRGVPGATEIIEPEHDGLYAIGGFPWCWYAFNDDGITPRFPFHPQPEPEAPASSPHAAESPRTNPNPSLPSSWKQPGAGAALPTTDTTDTYVRVDGGDHIYPARVYTGHGWVSPGFTLDTVRQLAAVSEKEAETDGYDVLDQILVINGEPEPVVLYIRWEHLISEGPASAVEVIKRDANGFYWIGRSVWNWHIEPDGPLVHTKDAADDAFDEVLLATARRMGEIVRTLKPDATACTIDPTTACIVAVHSWIGSDWPTGTDTDGEDGYGPFDTETLGAADTVLRRALDHNRDHETLEACGWCPVRDPDGHTLYRLVFAPDFNEAGDGPLDAAHATLAEARRNLLTESVPKLVEEARDAVPGAVGLVTTRTSLPRPVSFHTDGYDPNTTQTLPIDPTKLNTVRQRLNSMFAHGPTPKDLIASGWAPALPVFDEPDAYVLTFPAQ